MPADPPEDCISALTIGSSVDFGPLRIGILGAAGIARKNALAIANQHSNCVLMALASRSFDKARAFLKYLEGTQLTGERLRIFAGRSAYRKLIESDLVDAVYVPLPTALHKDWVLKALQHHKHVLVEKPVALNLDDLIEMHKEAQKYNRYLMDGSMFEHNPRTKDFLEACHSIGDIHRIESSFTFLGNADFFNKNIRCRIDCDPLGALGDLGWYSVRLAVLVFAELHAEPVMASAVDCTCNDQSVPIDVTCLVEFEESRKLVFHASFTTALRQEFRVLGSQQSAGMDDFVIPTPPATQYRLQVLHRAGADRTITRDYKVVEQAPPLADQQVLMWRHFGEICRDFDAAVNQAEDLLKGDRWHGSRVSDASALWATTRTTQAVVDAIMQSIKMDGAKVPVRL